MQPSDDTLAVVPPIPWPPHRVDDQLPDPKALVLAWKPLINGWDIVLGKQVLESPSQFSHWLPMLPPPPEIPPLTIPQVNDDGD